MKKFNFIILILTTLMPIFHLYGQFQCGFPNDVPIVKFSLSNRQDYAQVKLKVEAIMNDDGTKGVTKDEAETYMSAVVQEFYDDCKIEIVYCIEEVHDSYIYNHKDIANCNKLSLALHEYTVGGIGGAAGETGAWAKVQHNYIMHELGHIFGLPHTFNNYEVRDSSCLINPKGCAETVDQTNCDSSGVLVCDVTGDGFCDTPADRNSGITLDRCGVPYPFDSPLSLVRNHMSYNDVPNMEFSNEQAIYMVNYINTKLSDMGGYWEEDECKCACGVAKDNRGEWIFDKGPGYYSIYDAKITAKTLTIAKNSKLQIYNSILEGLEKITIENGASLHLYNVVIRPDSICQNSVFEGITVKNNAFLYVDDHSKIYNALNGIIVENNGRIHLSSLEIHGIKERGNVGIKLDQVDVIYEIQDLKIDNFNIGIEVLKYNYILNCVGEESNRNKFSNLDIGIKLYKTNANITFSDFENVRIGILSVLCFGSVVIKNNNIGYTQSGIVANITGGLHIEKNVIGYNNQFADNGIKIISSKNAYIFDNEIYALKNGILSFQNNAKIDNNLIDVKGYYSDGISYSGSDGNIVDNIIFGSSSEAGIDLFVGTDHLVENNDIYIMNAIPFTHAGIVKLQGTTECKIKENILYADRFSDGILLGNSGSNLFECNEVTNAQGNSINVDYNSEFQEIKTNTLTGRTDLIIKSEISVQRDKGNEFVGGTALALGLSYDEINNSLFYVNPFYTYNYPYHHCSPVDWFRPSSNKPDSCDTYQGQGNINIYDDPVRLCEYFNRLKVLQTTNPKLFMVKLMHILNYLKKHKKQVPDCIKVYVQRICGLDKISEVYVKLVGINKNDRENTLPLATIRENISADRIDAIKGSISDYKQYYQREYEGEMRLLGTLKNKLDSIQCPDTLIQIWKKVLLSYIDLISGDSMTTRTELTQIAKLCSYDYGEVVNLSRMMLSESDTTNYNVYDNCREAIIYRDNNSKISQEIDIYPNPTESNLTVDLPAIWVSGTLEIYNINGVLVEKVSIEKENRIELKLKLNNGTYMMKLNSSTGDLYVKKFVVIR